MARPQRGATVAGRRRTQRRALPLERGAGAERQIVGPRSAAAAGRPRAAAASDAARQPQADVGVERGQQGVDVLVRGRRGARRQRHLHEDPVRQLGDGGVRVGERPVGELSQPDHAAGAVGVQRAEPLPELVHQMVSHQQPA